MDFLDPKRKKSHRRRLFVGYMLMAVVLALGTWLLLNSSLGYWVDPKTGDVIQNGTIFLDSQPSGSTVTLDGAEQGNKTATRLVLPGSKQYKVSLTNNGYRDWSRTLALDGGKIERLVYPLLLPKVLITNESQLYASAPAFATQSPDRKWLLIQEIGQTSVFDLYDLSNPSATPLTVAIPLTSMTEPAKTTGYNNVEWASDNRHVLLNRVYGDAHEYIMLDTTNVASSVNVNTTLTVNATSMTLRDNKADQLYIYDAVAGTIRQGDLKNRTVSGAILSNVLAYKSLGADTILYSTHQGAATGKLSYRIRENDKATYLLNAVPDTTTYLLDVAEFNGTPYYVVGSPSDNAAFVFRDPLPALKGQSQTPLLVSAVLRVSTPEFVSFSITSQFIAAQSGSKLVVYDTEGDRQYRVALNHDIPANNKIGWMDGYRLTYNDKQKSYMVDFDGSNEQILVPTQDATRPFFSPDFKTMFTLAPSLKVPGRSALTQTSLVKK